MNIHLATYSTRPRGGVVHTLALAEALAELGHDLTVWTLARGGDETFFRPVDQRVRVEAVPFPDVDGEGVGPRILRSIATLAANVDTAGADVVHAQDCISANALPGCLRTVHHIDRFTTPELAACHERAIVEPAGHVCVSRAVADELRSGWGIEATVIPNGVDAARFASTTPDQRRAWRQRLDRGGPLLVAVGGIEPRKGTIDLPDVLAALPHARLVIAGGETLFDHRAYREAFDERVDALGVDVEVLGPVDHDTLPALVAAADVFAFPSTQEGFGLAAMEALAAGVPVVCRPLPVLEEVFGDTVYWGVDADTFAAALAGGPRPGGRALAEAHTWEAAARAHVDFYQRAHTGVRWVCGA